MQVSASAFAVTGLGYDLPWLVNAGFVVGEEQTLIVDTGGCRLSAQTVLGYARVARPGNRMLAVNLEPHFDHLGGNGYLKSQGVELWSHELVNRTEEDFAEEKADFHRAIRSEMRRERNEEEIFFGGTELTMAEHRIKTDTRFELGGVDAEVLLMPGHTAANLAVWVAQERVLFAADTLLAGYEPNLEAGNVALWRQWLDSLERIEKLRPHVVVPGHGQVLGEGRIAAAIGHTRQVLAESIARGQSPEGR